MPLKGLYSFIVFESEAFSIIRVCTYARPFITLIYACQNCPIDFKLWMMIHATVTYNFVLTCKLMLFLRSDTLQVLMIVCFTVWFQSFAFMDVFILVFHFNTICTINTLRLFKSQCIIPFFNTIIAYNNAPDIAAVSYFFNN